MSRVVFGVVVLVLLEGLGQWVLLVHGLLVDLLDELLDDLVVVLVLAVVALLFLCVFVLALEEPQVHVVGVDFSGSGVQGGVAVLAGPLGEDLGEEVGEGPFEVLLVRLDFHRFVQIVLDRVSNDQQVKIGAFDFLAVGLGRSFVDVLAFEVRVHQFVPVKPHRVGLVFACRGAQHLPGLL